MTNDPYKDFDDPYSADPQPPQAQPGSDPQWGPQPVTGPQNPFTNPSPPPQQGQGPIYGQTYGSQPSNPFGASGYLPAQYGYNAPPPDRQRHAGMLKLNVWLSAFFPLLGVIFFFVEKGKQPLYDKHLKETFNMSLTRMLIGFGAAAFSGWIASILGLATVVYFVLAIMGAVNGPQKFLEGKEMRYKGAIPFTRD